MDVNVFGWLVVFKFFIFIYNVNGCTIGMTSGVRSKDRDHSEPTEVKVYYSDVVVYGKAGETVSVNHPLEEFEGLYTMSFDSLCSYKGGQIPKSIHIAGIGNMNDAVPECPRVPVHFERQYYQVMFLKRTRRPDVFEAEFKANEVTLDHVNDLLRNLTMSCGLDLHEDSAMDHCLQFIPKEEGCKRYVPPMFTPRPARTTTTQKPTTTTSTTTSASTTSTPPPPTTTTTTPPPPTTTTTTTTTTPPTTTTTSTPPPPTTTTPITEKSSTTTSSRATTTTLKPSTVTSSKSPVTTVSEQTKPDMMPEDNKTTGTKTISESSAAPTLPTTTLTKQPETPMTSEAYAFMTSYPTKPDEPQMPQTDSPLPSEPAELDTKGPVEEKTTKPEPGAETSRENTGESGSPAGGTGDASKLGSSLFLLALSTTALTLSNFR